MNLVEAEATGPIEGDEAQITPPRPPHRRVSVSLVFTLTVLVGTVVAIYMTFPARNTVLMSEAVARHRDPAVDWDLVRPSTSELRAWATGVVGKDTPLPRSAVVLGARDTQVLGRRAAVIRLAIEDVEVTYLVQHTRVISPDISEQTSGELRAIAWRDGAFTCVAVGPVASVDRWSPVVR